MSAMKAGMSRNTARKHLRQSNPLEQRPQPHTWRTREDPLEAIWPRALEMLRTAPELEAGALFTHLLAAHPDRVSEKHRRTFQRRVRQWRLVEGPEKEVFFTQDHKPGAVLAADWTEMDSLQITIAGRPFPHKFFHAVLPYSNWEWGQRALGESVLSLRGGLNAVLGRLGRVPRELLTDHSSTATHQLSRDGKRRGFNEEFLGICAHFGITPRTINVGRPQENGDCESSHGHLKRRIRQHLLLRGSRDFGSEQEYDRFVAGVMESANVLRTERLKEELAAMGETAPEPVPDYLELIVTVGTDSTIRLRKLVYSVPCRLIGAKLVARLYENRIVLLSGAQEVAQLPAGRGDSGGVINHLLRKPGAFAGYRWREAMFPSVIYRAAYDHLKRAGDEESADRRYLEVLKVAADEGQTAVENALEHLLVAPHPVITAAEVRAVLDTWREIEHEWRGHPGLEVRLEDYDALLEGTQEDGQEPEDSQEVAA